MATQARNCETCGEDHSDVLQRLTAVETTQKDMRWIMGFFALAGGVIGTFLASIFSK